VGFGAEPLPKAVRKPLVAIVLNRLSIMFYSKTIKNLAHDTLNFTPPLEIVPIAPNFRGSVEPPNWPSHALGITASRDPDPK